VAGELVGMATDRHMAAVAGISAVRNWGGSSERAEERAGRPAVGVGVVVVVVRAPGATVAGAVGSRAGEGEDRSRVPGSEGRIEVAAHRRRNWDAVVGDSHLDHALHDLCHRVRHGVGRRKGNR
jgi:hypothetical protein